MNLNRDISIIEKIYNYCNEIDEYISKFLSAIAVISSSSSCLRDR